MRVLLLFLLSIFPLFAAMEHLNLDKAIELVKKNNHEIKIAKFNEQLAHFKTKLAQSYNYGMLDLTFNALRSDDAGNVFGFKLQSREASFADFGFDQFLAPMGQFLGYMYQDLASGKPNPQAFAQQAQGLSSILKIQPQKLNYPKARNHFQTKITYKLPLFTGFKLTMYEKISQSMERLSHLDTKKVLNQKIYEVKKTFYDITLVENYIKNLKILKSHMDELERIIQSFKAEGYAKKTDLLEVQARKAEVESYLNQAKLNRNLAYQYLSFLLDSSVGSIEHVNELAPLPTEPTRKLVQRALDYKKAKVGKRITRMNIKLQRSEFLPTIGAFGEYGSSDNRPFNDFFDKDAYTVGGQLKWNIFSGGGSSAKVQEAKIKDLQMNEKLILAKKGLALKIDQLRTAVKSKDADIKAQTKQYELAKAIYEMYEAKYKEGIERISNVLIKHAEEIKALMALLKTKTERNKKALELESLLDKE